MGNNQVGTDSEKLLVFVKKQAKSKTLFWPVCLSSQVCREESCGEIYGSTTFVKVGELKISQCKIQ
jgi:hypothetical protein